VRRKPVQFVVFACLTAAGVLAGNSAAHAEPTNPGETPARSAVSNMGLCSAYLGQLGVRADVNHLLKQFGPFLPDGPFENPGELYRIRARQHPNASAESECERR
jgi:hypothetical protein